ncbi:hypothetical protein ACLM5H_10935 [Fredinandcohnia humi]
MVILLLYVTPIIAIVFFVNCVSLVKKIVKGEDTANNTGWGAIMFGYIIFSLIMAVLLN